MSETLQSRPYKPETEKCCERCVFGTGAHASWCDVWRAALQRTYLRSKQANEAMLHQDYDHAFSR